MHFWCSLPPELWTRIFWKLSEYRKCSERDDIPDVRLVCRLFENLATPFLLSRIRCAPLSSTLTSLTAVSLHPTLSRSVKEIVYVCNRFQDLILPEYQQALSAELSLYRKINLPTSDDGILDLKFAFWQYVQHYEDQVAMESSGEVAVRLCCALTRMPNVEKITISPNFDCVLKNYRHSKYFLEPKPAYGEAFLLMARVLSLVGTKLQEFNIERDFSGDSQRMTGELFRDLSDMSLTHCCNTFRGLRQVTIETSSQEDPGWMTGHLAKILSCATDLEELRIIGSFTGDYLYTEDLLSTARWIHLASLTVQNAEFDQWELLEFLGRHSDTLRNLLLHSIYLSDGSWELVLEGMKSSLSIHMVHIEDLVGHDEEGEKVDIYPGDDAIQCYFFSDGPNPLANLMARLRTRHEQLAAEDVG